MAENRQSSQITRMVARYYPTNTGTEIASIENISMMESEYSNRVRRIYILLLLLLVGTQVFCGRMSAFDEQGKISLIRLVDGMKHVINPAWSPDGTRIAFISGDYDNMDIYVVNLEDSNLMKLTDDTVNPQELAWSPDGSRIVFFTSNPVDIHVIDKNGLNMMQLTERVFRIDDITWSPGSRIIFSKGSGIFAMDADGSNRTILANKGNDGDPAWSPDGSRIAFSVGLGDDADIFIMDADGVNIKKLTFGEGYDGDPTWSPDGTRIAYISRSDQIGVYDICVIDIDDANIVQLTDGIETIYPPTWSPDGTRIAYQSGDIGDSAIYIVDAVNLDVTPLIDNFGYVTEFTWSPDGSRIAFVSNFSGIYVYELDK